MKKHILNTFQSIVSMYYFKILKKTSYFQFVKKMNIRVQLTTMKGFGNLTYYWR